MSATLFDTAFADVVGVEGGYDTTRDDPGNWTGGAVGKGVLKGTHFGVSAGSYPNLDIENLTLADAKAIYARDFWTRVRCDAMPAPLAYFAFDAAVNEGVGFAARTVQASVGVEVDGDIGPQTLAAIAAADPVAAVTEFAARRMVQYGDLRLFSEDGLGWSRRLMKMFRNALALAPVAAST